MRDGGESFVNGSETSREIPGDIQDDDSVLIGLMAIQAVQIKSLKGKKETTIERPKRGGTSYTFNNRHLAQEIARSKHG